MENSEKILPQSVFDAANQEVENLIPDKSKAQYEIYYQKFIDWKNTQSIKSSNELTVLLAYFNELSNKYKTSSLWNIYYMLKKMLIVKEEVDINKYHLLIAFLKKKSSGFISKKSKVLTSQEVKKFLKDAPDEIHPVTKVALIFGVFGACRGGELVNIKIQDITKQGNLLVVNLPDTKNKVPRKFVIDENFTATVRKYKAFRRPTATTDRFFLNYQQGRCTTQVFGKHKFQSMPKTIAKYLNLQGPDSYTGHAFRRASATILADSGADTLALKRLGGWKSSTVAEGYVEESVANKAKVSRTISTSITSTKISLNQPGNAPTSIGFTSAKNILCESQKESSSKRQKTTSSDASSDLTVNTSKSESINISPFKDVSSQLNVNTSIQAETINLSPKKGQIIFNNSSFTVQNFNTK
ncbi:uncharacterized protein LOC127288739 [Leptopilina boulardi]|uniref:uncharacterized protein LOC127288739 n=1 Tax=Leptopilina boulardi TaxID=63433 RepID=UPI0021F54854|nr:uncharacterized protein LOC127288739 [Leptopilina boulardi]